MKTLTPNCTQNINNLPKIIRPALVYKNFPPVLFSVQDNLIT